jgi:hypothetical protein
VLRSEEGRPPKGAAKGRAGVGARLGRRAVLLPNKVETFFFFFKSRVESHFDDSERAFEGCLSQPDVFLKRFQFCF